MPVTFVLGRAGAGKTRHCLDAVLAELERRDERRRLLLLVPEQASFQMERALAVRSPRGGYSRAAVVSFSRLTRTVFDQTGGEPAVLGAGARVMALRTVVAGMRDTPRVLRAAFETNGFYVQLERMIEELLLECVAPAELLAAAERLETPTGRRKVKAIARIYEAYLDWLGRERVDPALRLAALRERLGRVAWLHDSSIWVDGFAGFTGQELETLVTLGRAARDVTVTLLTDPASATRVGGKPPAHLDLFARTTTTWLRLRASFADAGVPIAPDVRLEPARLPRFVNSPELAGLERGLARPGDGLPDGVGAAKETPEVCVLECETHREELRQAARFIRERMADSAGELRFRDFAVIARDLEPFAETVAEVFDEYEIPYFLDRRRRMGSHALSRFMDALFEAISSDFSTAAMTRLLRTRLLPLSRAEAEALENTILAHEVRGEAIWRARDWAFAQSGPAAARRGASVAADLNWVERVARLLELSRKDAGGAEWARGLNDVLERLAVRERIAGWIDEARAEGRYETAEVHRLAWDALCEVLENLHDVLGQTPVSLGEVTAIVGAALRETTLGMAPPTLDQVLVGSIERSRHPDIKYAWVFAFNEGIFPARPADDALLSTAERDALAAAGLRAPAPHRDEAFGERMLAYIAFTRASQGVTISYATTSDDAAKLPASALLADVRRALPSVRVQSAPSFAPPVCLPELAWEQLEALGSDRETRYAQLVARVREDAGASRSLDRLLRGLVYDNCPGPLPAPDAGGDVGRVWNATQSEIETYLQCPFKHFAEFRLRLEPRRGPVPLAWDLGSAAHEILAAVTRAAMREPGGVRAIADARWHELLNESLTIWLKGLPDDLRQRRPDAAFLFEFLGQFLAEIVLAHAARWRRGRFEPLYVERSFDGEGGDDALPAIELSVGADGRIRVRGKIDRVDRCELQGRSLFVVYDYKSKAPPVRAEVLTGARLQLFTYLLALSHDDASREAMKAAGVFRAPLRPDFGVFAKKYAADADEHELRMHLYRPRGLVTTEAARLLDEQLGTSPSPVAQLRLTKTGEFYKSGDAVEPEELARYLELARRTLRRAAEDALAGRIDVAPLVENQTLACRDCSYRPLCRFDRALNTPRLAERVLPVLSDIAADAEHESP